MTMPTTATIMAIGGLVMVFAVLLLLFFIPLPADNASTAQLILGALLVWVGSAFAYYYGSTKSSQAKDDTIHTMAKSSGTGNGASGAASTTTTVTTTETGDV